MVKGLDLFRDHFREHKAGYVLIGGAACDLVMEQAGLVFRATKDLDIVLQIEVLDKSFCETLMEETDLKSLGIRNLSLETVLGELRKHYGGS